jgi:hypothetical protein
MALYQMDIRITTRTSAPRADPLALPTGSIAAPPLAG